VLTVVRLIEPFFALLVRLDLRSRRFKAVTGAGCGAKVALAQIDEFRYIDVYQWEAR